MMDVEYIIEYIKYLKKGFDKDEFNDRIVDLAHIVDTVGLDYEDFHTLFKLWLNLSIPVTKWTSVGLCLVPRERVEEKTVDYAIRWLLANYRNQTSLSRIGFVLDWLTAAMDSDSIDLEALNIGYDFFYMLLSYEILTPHAMKLVYTMTKPGKVSRKRVLELLNLARIRDAKKSLCRQILVLLGLFKSYKPENVPETIPAFSIHTAFRKINSQLVERFNRCQGQRNSISDDKQRLQWSNPLHLTTKKADPLIPNVEFVNIGSKQYNGKDQKTYFDYNDPSSLLSDAVRGLVRRPARLRALLSSAPGLVLLATASADQHAFLAHDLHHLLVDCFLETSPYSYSEKQYFLQRLACLQNTLMQGVPVITKFLAQYLPFWNETDFFHEILQLVVWLSPLCPAELPYALRPLARAHLRAPPVRQAAIMHALVDMYNNLVYASMRERHYFMNIDSSQNYGPILASLSTFIMELCTKSIQANPGSPLVSMWSQRASLAVCAGASRLSVAPPLARRLLLAAPLFTYAPVVLDDSAALMIGYNQLFSKLKKKSTSRSLEDRLWTLQTYTAELFNCLWNEKAFSERSDGSIFNALDQNVVQELCKSIPNSDGALSLRSHVAFAPYTYTQIGEKDYKGTDNRLWFDSVIEPEFTNISRFLKKVA